MNHSKSGLFLMELIISILFFSLASAVCIRLFAHAHIISRETVNQNNAITYAQNLAEGRYAAESSPDRMQQQLSGSLLSEDGMSIFLIFDREWHMLNSTDSSDICYVAELTSVKPVTAEDLNRAYIAVYPLPDSLKENWSPVTYIYSSVPHEIIYSLELKLHISERRDSLEQ